MNTPTLPTHQMRRLQAHYGFGGMPFRKNVPTHRMFDSRSQRDLAHGLRLWSEIHGLSLLASPTGNGKSITTRKFATELDDARFKVFRLNHVPTTPMGFLRSLNRVLCLPPRRNLADLFDQVRNYLYGYAEAHGPHPMLIIDDAEGMRPETLDIIRRLTTSRLDADDTFSVLLIGTEDLLMTLRQAQLAPLQSRFTYVAQLRPFSLEDTINYVRFHLKEAGGDPELFTDEAVRHIFHASQGTPRKINQLALQALIQAAVESRNAIDGRFMRQQIDAHPLYTRGDQ
ncbi:MAG: AAA family ATPase [Victivallales bacterium]|jgi:MSHA biogenesis protein MshM|nr:AAA family ATPase [Pseudomonadota bacterium]MBT7302807.1 AAA family ATPase [Victivallales bacterium]